MPDDAYLLFREDVASFTFHTQIRRLWRHTCSTALPSEKCKSIN